jgi:Fic family protein
MKNLADYLDTTTMHPILRSVEAHLEIARIHPYEDGNGRSARLVQNFCLQERGYPAPIIKESERQLYFKLLRQALKDRSTMKSSIEKPSEMEVPFHEFIASKVLESARDMEEELKKRRMYEVDLEGCTKDTLFSTADRIRSFNRSSGSEGVSVRKERHGDQGTLYVVGDISKDQLEELIKQSAKRYKFKHSIKVSF